MRSFIYVPILLLILLLPSYVNTGFIDYTETGAYRNFKMTAVKSGTFWMGCTDEQGCDYSDDEKPIHRVTLSDYYIGKYEVTQAEWTAATTRISKATICRWKR